MLRYVLRQCHRLSQRLFPITVSPHRQELLGITRAFIMFPFNLEPSSKFPNILLRQWL